MSSRQAPYAARQPFFFRVAGAIAGGLREAKLDRAAWIVAFGAVAACVAPVGDEIGSDTAALAARWSLPADVRAVGADVHLHYDAAPRWSTPPKCAGGLTDGARKLGTFLRERFTVIPSVGGYACRKNTADGSRVSVHGTGRALDVFIPMAGSKADSDAGDPVANWLVEHAATIGVQLIIWNRSIWRGNGTNEGVYHGPVPHIDHIHVELTIDASKEQTEWFTSGAADADPTEEMPRDGETDAGDGGSEQTGDLHPGAPAHPAPEDEPDAGPGPSDPGPSDPGPSDPAPSEPEEGEQDDGEILPDQGTQDPEWEQAEDEAPTERDSLGTSPRTKRTSVAHHTHDELASAGCAAAPFGPGSPGSSGAVVSLAAVAFAISRRRRRRTVS